MKVPELFTGAEIEPFDFKPFLRRNLKHGMPPLDTKRLAIDAIVGEQRLGVREQTIGSGSLVIGYKKKPGVVLAVNEIDDGDVWDILQVQGFKGKKPYRVASSMEWGEALGTRLKQFSDLPESEVRQITMDPFCQGDAVEGNLTGVYGAVRKALGMRFSEESQIFVRDVKR